MALALCVMAPLATAGLQCKKASSLPKRASAHWSRRSSRTIKRCCVRFWALTAASLSVRETRSPTRTTAKRLSRHTGEANKIVLESDSQATLVIGDDEWPMPIPLVKSGGRWRFDSRQGEKEILARRIGANELAAIQVCLAIVDAEHEYAAQDRAGDGVPHYAARFVSTPGNHDGLYWETQTDEPPSPLGPLLAAAASEGYTNSEFRTLEPYHGYYYKILTSQGADAPGGAYDYLVKGKMIGGFAVLAYPARYGASGVMSFMVNHEGVVYEKNLGRRTAERAAEITSFNPDASWKKQ